MTYKSGYSQEIQKFNQESYNPIFNNEMVEFSFSDKANSTVENDNIAVIAIKVKEEGYMILNIFNEKGSLVQTLIDGYMYPGYYSVIFKTFSPELRYFYRLVSYKNKFEAE